MSETLLKALDPRRSVVVRACAGSGKTWLLASRIARILLDDESAIPGHILAITFTRAAAGEIAERVLDRVRELAEAGSDGELDAKLALIGATAPTPRQRDRARKLHRMCLLSSPRMAVNTFHGWFRQLAQALPWSAGTAREAAVIGQAAEQRDRAWTATVRDAARGGNLAPAMEHLFARMAPDRIRPMLDTMVDKRLQWEMRYRAEHDSDEAAELCAKEADRAVPDGADEAALFADRERLLGASKKIAAALDESGATATVYGANFVGGYARAEEARSAPDFTAHLREALLTKDGKPRKQLRARLARSGEEAPFDELAALLKEAGGIAAARAAAQFNRAAAAVAARYARKYSEEKKRDGMADFADLELPVWRAIALGGTGAQEFAERLDRTYRHILVDEFQDTSPPQWQIMREWLQSAHGTGSEPRVFIVGDPKQSVYGFRGADPRLMAEAASFLAGRYRGITLPSNTTRRCAQAIVDVVNEVFADLPEENFAGFEPHLTTRAELPGAVLVLPGAQAAAGQTRQEHGTGVLRDPLRQAPPSAEKQEMQLAEGAQIAAVLHEALSSWAVFDTAAGAERRCNPADIMVLYPTRGASEFAARMLRRAGIPCALPDSGGRMLDLECVDMIALMRAVCDPRNAAAVAHTLRSPVFNVHEDDLWAVHNAGGGELGVAGNWDAGLRLARGSEDLTRAQSLLTRWRQRYLGEHLPAHELLAGIYRDADIYGRYVGSLPAEMGERCVRNLERIMNCAIEMDGGRVVQLSQLARRLASPGEMQAGDSRAIPRPADCVAMMTVHAAKGLESPVVVLSNSEAAGRTESAQALVRWQPGEAAPRHCSFCRSRSETNPAQTACWEANETARGRERLHLLYVGMTRASQVLVLSATRGTRKGFDWHSRVGAAMGRLNAAHDSKGRLLHGQSLATAWQPAKPESGARRAAQAEPVLKRAGKPDTGDSSSLRRGVQLHKLMALLLSGIDDTRAHCAVLGLTRAGEDRLRAVANKMLGCAEFSALRDRAVLVRTEFPVCDGDDVHRIDCLLDTGTEKWIIDFKSCFDPDTAGHRLKLATYRQILLNAGHSGPMRLALLGGSGSWQEITG